MNEMNILDEKAIQILLKYDGSEEPNLSTTEFEYAKKKGIMYDEFTYTHDEYMELVIAEYQKFKEKKAVTLFINSLVDNELIKRVGLGAGAIMKTFINHSFECREENLPIKDTTPCKICSSWYSLETDPNIRIQSMFRGGGVSGTLLSDIFLALKLTNLIKSEAIKQESIFLFKRMMDIIKNAEPTDTPKLLSKKIAKAKILKTNEWQRQCILDTLGYCGILHTEKYKGPFYEYINLGIAPSKRHSSDWRYPVDWWTGKDGIDKVAFKYWFGSFEELRDFWM